MQLAPGLVNAPSPNLSVPAIVAQAQQARAHQEQQRQLQLLHQRIAGQHPSPPPPCEPPRSALPGAQLASEVHPDPQLCELPGVRNPKPAVARLGINAQPALAAEGIEVSRAGGSGDEHEPDLNQLWQL